MEELNYAAISAELVRAIRGGRTQRALGRKAGFSSNVLYSWESGRSNPAASTFFRLAYVGRPELVGRINRFGRTLFRGFDARELPTPDGVAALMRELAADEPIVALARELNSDRTTVTRWLSGRTEPRLPDFLHLVQQTTQRVLQFVELFTDPLRLKSTSAAFQSLVAQQRIASELPMSHSVLRALELTSYEQVAPGDHIAFISRQTGIPAQDAEFLLGALQEADLIQERDGKWRLKDVMTVDTRRSIERDVELKRFWMDVARSRLDVERLMQTSMFSYNLFAVSNHSYDQIRALHLEYYEKVRRIVATDTDPQRVVLLNMQLVALDESK